MQQTTVLQFFKPAGYNPPTGAQLRDLTIPHISPQARSQPADNESELATTHAADGGILTHLESVAGDVTKDDFFVPPQFPNAVVTKLLPSHLPQVKQLTSTLLPIRYPDTFFESCLSDSVIADVSRVVLCESKAVGWVRCRLDAGADNSHELYVQALGLLAPWRGLGLASALLDQITKPSILHRHNITLVYAHVWQVNDDALEWYQKRGFERVRLEPQYYRRLKPSGAWIVRKQLTSN